MKQFQSTHKLDFEVAEWTPLFGLPAAQNFKRFRVGTCEGLWQCTETSYDILAIDNKVMGNGHFDDTLEWFENSCKRDGKSLRVLELFNDKLKKHLIDKKGFKDIGNDNVEKIF